MNIERKSLVAALERVKPALQASGKIESFKHVWIDGQRLYAYNGGLGIRVKWKTDLEPCGINGAVLLGLLQSSGAEEVTLDQENNAQLALKMGRATTKLSRLDADGNPWPFPFRITGTPLSLELTEELIEGLKHAQIVKSANPQRVEHYGITIFPGKDKVALYSSTGEIIAEVFVKGKISKELERTVLPFGFVSQLLAFDVGSKIIFTSDFIIAESNGIQVCSNLLDSSDVYDLPEVVNTTVTGEEKRVALPEGFGETMKRAEILAGAEGNSSCIYLSHNKRELEVKGDLKYGVLQDKFPVSVTGSAKLKVSLDHILGLYGEAEEVAVTEKVLLLYGQGESLYVVAAHG